MIELSKVERACRSHPRFGRVVRRIEIELALWGAAYRDNGGAFDLEYIDPAPEPSAVVHGIAKIASNRRWLRALASSGSGWEHVSVSAPDRAPTWDEMEAVKRLLLGDVVAMQLHLPRAQHVNCHPHCLHVWVPRGAEDPAAAALDGRWRPGGLVIERLLRLWFATFAPPMPDSVWGGDPNSAVAHDSDRAAYLAVVALWRFEYADAMLEERRSRSREKGVMEI